MIYNARVPHTDDPGVDAEFATDEEAIAWWRKSFPLGGTWLVEVRAHPRGKELRYVAGESWK